MKKALVVDDSEGNRLIIGTMVSEYGLSIVYAEDGESAIHTFTAVNPDIVFIDQIMPGMLGSDATKTMKLLTRECPIILMSALANPEEIQETVEQCGANEFLPKPISTQTIQATLRKYRVIE